MPAPPTAAYYAAAPKRRGGLKPLLLRSRTRMAKSGTSRAIFRICAKIASLFLQGTNVQSTSEIPNFASF